MTDTLFADWISALSLLRGPVSPLWIARTFERTALRWSSPTETGLYIAALTHKPAEGFTGRPRRVTALVNPRLEPFYRIERIEALASVAIDAYAYCSSQPEAETLRLYKALGVWHSRLLDPATRWQRLSLDYHAGRVLASRFEDRPLCPMCSIPVATGSTNPHIHDGCRGYVAAIYAPALRRQKESQSNA